MLLLTLFSLFISQPQVDPYTTITNQVNIYIENVENSNQPDENFWALNELYSSNCGNNKIVERLISQSRSNTLQDIFNSFHCISESDEDSLKLERLKYYSLESGSFSIALHYLSQSDSQSELDEFFKNYTNSWASTLPQSKIETLRLIKNRSAISKIAINSIVETFSIYSLLYSDYVHKYFSTDQLGELIKKFNAERNKNYTPFDQSLIYYSLFKAAYETNKYQYITTLFDDLIKSNYYPNSSKKVGVFSGLDYALTITGNYSESLLLQRNVLLPLANHYDQKQRTDYTLLRQSANLYELGKYNEAKIVLEELYNDSNSTIPKSQLYNNLSLCYQKLGQKNKYTSFLLQAIQEINNDEVRNSNYYTVKLGIFRNLFVYYNDIGDSSNAISYINRAQDLAKQQTDQNELAAIQLYLGDYYWKNFGDSNKSLNHYNKAEEILKGVDNYRREREVLVTKSSMLINIDSLSLAKSSISKIKSLSSRNSDTPAFIEALIFEGEIALIESDLAKLESILEEIRVYSIDELEFEVLIRYHTLDAKLLRKRGKHRDAYTYYKPIMDQIIEWARGSVESQTGFWTVEEEYLDAFELMISITSDLNNIEESIAYLDQLKTINDASLYNNPLLKANKLTEKELAEDKKLTAQIQALRNEYLSADINQKTALKTEIDKLSAQRQLLSNKVTRAHRTENLPIWKIQQQMDVDELILHYTELNEQFYVSSISRSNITLSKIDLTPEADSLLNKTANDLAAGSTSLNSLYEVYNLLDLEDIPSTINQISVIPDNELYRIPLDILPTKKPNTEFSFGSSRYMIEDYNFKYFTSLQDYSSNNRNTKTSLSNDFSAFAISYFDGFQNKDLPSLPFATQEAKNIQETLTVFNKKNVFSGNSATEQAFQEQLNTSRILHVATHSEVSTQDPLFSTIYLKSAISNGTEGEALYAYELFDNQLNNELIMLNSCSSGTGNYLQGTGIMGISRALRYAGAKSLALNLWEVNDKIASEFATDFYSYLNKGYSKSEAMRFAKITQIKTGSADPHFWGAYTLIGNSSPVIKKPTSSQFILPLLLTVGLLVGFRVRSKSETF